MGTHSRELGALRRAGPGALGQISARELELIDGQREVLAGHISAVYDISPLAAQMQLEAWQAQLAAGESR